MNYIPMLKDILRDEWRRKDAHFIGNRHDRNLRRFRIRGIVSLIRAQRQKGWR